LKKYIRFKENVVELKEAEKIVYLFPKNLDDFTEKVKEVEHNQTAEFYSYDGYASGIISMYFGDCNLMNGFLKVSKNSKDYIRLNYSQVTACKYFEEGGKHIFDFELKSHGTVTLIL